MHRHELDEHVDEVVTGVLNGLPPHMTQFGVNETALRDAVRPHVEAIVNEHGAPAGAAAAPGDPTAPGGRKKINWGKIISLVVSILTAAASSGAFGQTGQPGAAGAQPAPAGQPAPE
jgi:hypothetical protein